MLTQLSTCRIVPVIRTSSTELAYNAVRLLLNAGFHTAEITLSVPGAVELIKQFSAQENVLVGAGTVLNAKEAQACIEAGAKYIISPVLADHVPELCKEANVLCILSGLTPSEIYTAWNRGSAAIKVFPAHSMGGPGYLKSLRSVFPSIPLVPTGGVNLHNIGDYFQAGASFVGVGSDLVNTALIENDPASFIELGRKYLQSIET
ncbi:hypothetical protein SD71_20285 [Cohnella kolymensis]|uniref:2-dehydro-3-deoxyphosphogluconate aldolase n=2 Tax=Cohnella kolymensis TaxID=1590652 RepID=A0ABR5A1B2_9BACL|nr:hypothetical protein SD71_20285 [Cohnella kolymensis]